MDEQRLSSLRELEERLGYQFKDIGWLDKALTHKSFVHQSNAVQTRAWTKRPMRFLNSWEMRSSVLL